jgi:hypothetical protein
MPFIVNPLIESVNPVKLYEYILSGKPTLAVRYGETNYFSEYVYLYNSYEEFEHYIKKLINESISQKNSMDEICKFCADNTWDKRAKEIKKVVDNIVVNKGE